MNHSQCGFGHSLGLKSYREGYLRQISIRKLTQNEFGFLLALLVAWSKTGGWFIIRFPMRAWLLAIGPQILLGG